MNKPLPKTLRTLRPAVFSTLALGGTAGYLLVAANPNFFSTVLPPTTEAPTVVSPLPAVDQLQQLAQPFQGALQHFTLAAASGSVGAAAVYPIDLVKTRMQTQVSTNGVRMYKHSLDCFLKVISTEGFLGLYKGLGPQLLGVTPEKAMELCVNDLMRATLLTDRNESNLPLEMVAGGVAGASQVFFTNPVEIVKIRLQVQGESIRQGLMKTSERQTGMSIVKELGLRKLYFGASACLLRDAPFSAIYFSSYPRMKKVVANGEPLSKPGLLLAGAVCGIPAAALVTPADVVKTRLQRKARVGEVQHVNIRSCASHIWRAEGPSAFFKGAMARVCRSSPQFGVTLFVYEMLQTRFFPEAQH